MKIYDVDISPDAKKEFLSYLDGAVDFGDDTVSELLNAFETCIDLLEATPYAGSERLRYIPSKYKILHLWKHYWMIFQIYENRKKVVIEYVIDDRQNYGKFVH